LSSCGNLGYTAKKEMGPTGTNSRSFLSPGSVLLGVRLVDWEFLLSSRGTAGCTARSPAAPSHTSYRRRLWWVLKGWWGW